MSDEIKPKLDDFTAKVVNDPAKPQETLLLQGFLGASSQPDHTRVYADLTLASYVDVANADIIHIEPMPKEQSPMGGSYLWVKKDADVLPGTPTGPSTAKAKFLQGPIAAEGAGAVAQPAGLPPRITVPIVACHPTIFLPACAPSIRPGSCVTETVFPTRNPCVVGTGLACQIPDPTIFEQTVQVQQQQFAAAAAPAAQAAAPSPQRAVTAYCPSVFCQPTETHIRCVFYTPNCPQVAVNQTFAGPDCVAATPLCPVQGASIACGEQQQTGAAQQFGFAAVAPTRLHCAPTTLPALCPAPTSAAAHCPPKTSQAAHCPPTPNIQHCPTPNMICQTPNVFCPPASFFDVCQTAGNLC